MQRAGRKAQQQGAAHRAQGAKHRAQGTRRKDQGALNGRPACRRRSAKHKTPEFV